MSMNGNLEIKIDMDRVQSSVQAAIRPSVDEALASCDIKAVIKKTLEQPVPQDRFSYLIYGGHRHENITGMGDAGISQHALDIALCDRHKVPDKHRQRCQGP